MRSSRSFAAAGLGLSALASDVRAKLLERSHSRWGSSVASAAKFGLLGCPTCWPPSTPCAGGFCSAKLRLLQPSHRGQPDQNDIACAQGRPAGSRSESTCQAGPARCSELGLPSTLGRQASHRTTRRQPHRHRRLHQLLAGRKLRQTIVVATCAGVLRAPRHFPLPNPGERRAAVRSPAISA